MILTVAVRPKSRPTIRLLDSSSERFAPHLLPEILSAGRAARLVSLLRIGDWFSGVFCAMPGAQQARESLGGIWTCFVFSPWRGGVDLCMACDTLKTATV